MDVRKRAIFLDNVIQKTDLSAERLDARLSCLDHRTSLKLARSFRICPMVVFMKYIRILSIGQVATVGDHTIPAVASDEYATTTIKKDSKAVSQQGCDEPKSRTGIHKPGSPCRKHKAYKLPFPPPDEALKPAESQLCQLVHSLPPELFERLQRVLLQTVFEPRRIHPGVESLNLHILGALDRAMYAKQRNEFLSESVWVMVQGNYEEAQDFLGRIPLSITRSIKKMELRPTKQDYKYRSLDRYFALPNDPSFASDRFGCLLAYMAECHRTRHKLVNIWLRKIGALAALQLSQLVLDFSDAYGSDGEFLGRSFAIPEDEIQNDGPAHVLVLGTDDR